MKYYLVALFDEESCNYIEYLQKNLCKKYKLSKSICNYHIPIEIIGDPNIEKLEEIVAKILHPYKKFKVMVKGISLCDKPYKALGLNIDDKGYIIRLARNINDSLILHGFNVKESSQASDMHVSLASLSYSFRKLLESDLAAASIEEHDIATSLKIDRFELWKPINNKKEAIIRSFPLRDF